MRGIQSPSLAPISAPLVEAIGDDYICSLKTDLELLPRTVEMLSDLELFFNTEML